MPSKELRDCGRCLVPSAHLFLEGLGIPTPPLPPRHIHRQGPVVQAGTAGVQVEVERGTAHP